MNTKILYEAVYNMLVMANTGLCAEDYAKFKDPEILQNAYLARKTNRPLCQDTGQVVIFLKIGQEIQLQGEFIESALNRAVEDCYRDNFYRKSVVKDAVYDRNNSETNTPAIIHTKFQRGNEISILTGIKGGGAENMTRLKMMSPTSSLDDILDFARETVEIAGENACPPVTIGIGAGGTAELAAIYAKYALFKGKKISLCAPNILEAKIVTGATHIACLPVCVNLNCHSLRHAECKIKGNEIYYDYTPANELEIKLSNTAKKVDINGLDGLKTGDKILFTGKIYTARDMAHKRIVETLERGEKPPFELKNAVIFYAGPCPAKEGEIIGPVGPTTSKRMDKFAPALYKAGVKAAIGKGGRNIKGGYLYLKAKGGVACLYQKCVKSAKIAAYPDLGAEAVYELYVENMPLEVEIL